MGPSRVSTVSYYRLVVDSGENAGMVYPMRGDLVTIGRGPENTIQIVDSRISREHVRLRLRRNGWWIEDLNSKNGTLINSKALLEPVRLAPGDVLHVGNARLIYESEFGAPPELTDKTGSTGVRVSLGESGLHASHRLAIDDAGTTSLHAIPEDADARLSSIYQVGQVIQSILDLDEMLGKLMQIVARVLTPTHAAVFLHDAQMGALVPRAVHRSPGHDEEAVISQSILHQSMEERVGVIMTDGKSDKRFQDADSVIGNRIRSAICVPLVAKGEVHGAVYLDVRDDGRPYRQSDLQWLVGVAAQAALAVNISLLHEEALQKRQRERDLEIARSIQTNLLPKSMPAVEGFRFAGRSRPAHMVGGDYFDVASLSDGRVALAIADVSGKGIPAAILVASVRSSVRIEARSLPAEDIVTVVTRLNEAVCEETMSHMFVTMVLGVLDPARRAFTFCNAGHAHPILRLPSGEIRLLKAGGCFLGIDPAMAIEKETVEMPPGSLLVLYTDGVTDALNPAGEAFGMTRLVDFVQANHALGAEAFAAALEDAVQAFQADAEAFDDVTVLVVAST